METDKEKNINRLVDKMMKASELDKTSQSFTSEIMAEIESFENQKIKYTPIISKTTWLLIGGFIITLLVIFNFVEFQHQESFLKDYITFNFDFSLNLKSLNTFLDYSFSNVLIYCVLLFGLMFAIQIPLLKYYHLKQYNLYTQTILVLIFNYTILKHLYLFLYLDLQSFLKLIFFESRSIYRHSWCQNA